ncbi:uncharacterized protein DSM5745_00260 [Aspergillus mulundensis]|uniref:CDR ABC transporter domain-containing protein n=1 Tax=Aspergillus mulundensis TaxID=1810919 RepID=A0A3D8T4L4_9EURO|nr:hypothetical protein DSM5745_00260 [Aspergillus mulundensis]RDW92938.1 hypothetical protein DSM5745_00260 [Aspergillus mulundensis]
MSLSPSTTLVDNPTHTRSVVATPHKMPGFWIFMYQCSPFTYLVSGMLSTAISSTTATCDAIETFQGWVTGRPARQPNLPCAEYLGPFAQAADGAIQNPDATSACVYCAMAKTDDFLAGVNSYWGAAWRNFGLMWVYIAFNIVAAIGIYWLARFPKGGKRKA